MSTKPNNRSDAALHERLELAEKATQGPWYHTLAAIVGTKKSPEDNDATCICFTEWGCSGDPQANAAHIAASSPDVVRADIEEILRLRKEVARLNKEADWLGLRLWGTGGVPPVEDFDVRADRIKMWRKAARKAVEEKERYG